MATFALIIVLLAMSLHSSLQLQLSADNIFIIDDSSYQQTLNHVQKRDGAILIGITTQYCDYCLKMEEQLKIAAQIQLHSEEKLFFGLYNARDNHGLLEKLSIDEDQLPIYILYSSKDDMEPKVSESNEVDYRVFISSLRETLPVDPLIMSSFEVLESFLKQHRHHAIVGIFKNKKHEYYNQFIQAAREMPNLKFIASFNRYTLENKFFYYVDEIAKAFDEDGFAIAIVRKTQMVGRTVNNVILYTGHQTFDTPQSLQDFIIKEYLIDVDLYTPSSLPLYEKRNKPIGILVLPHILDPSLYEDRINFYSSAVANRLHERYNEQMDFALMYAGNFPHFIDKLDLFGDPFDIYYFIFDQTKDRLYKQSDQPVMKNADMLDPNSLLDFTINFLQHKVSQYKKSELGLNKPIQDSDGLMQFSAISLEAFFILKEYQKKELILFFYLEQDEQSELLLKFYREVYSELGQEYHDEVIFAKIKGKVNDPPDFLEVYRYPTIYLIHKSEFIDPVKASARVQSKDNILQFLHLVDSMLNRRFFKDYDEIFHPESDGDQEKYMNEKHDIEKQHQEKEKEWENQRAREDL